MQLDNSKYNQEVKIPTIVFGDILVNALLLGFRELPRLVEPLSVVEVLREISKARRHRAHIDRLCDFRNGFLILVVALFCHCRVADDCQQQNARTSCEFRHLLCTEK